MQLRCGTGQQVKERTIIQCLVSKPFGDEGFRD